MGHLVCLLITPQAWENSFFNVTVNSNIRGLINFVDKPVCGETKALINTGENCHVLFSGHSVRAKSWKEYVVLFWVLAMCPAVELVCEEMGLPPKEPII